MLEKEKKYVITVLYKGREQKLVHKHFFPEINKYVLDIHDVLCIILSRSGAETRCWN